LGVRSLGGYCLAGSPSIVSITVKKAASVNVQNLSIEGQGFMSVPKKRLGNTGR
jgi:hypothetical protein